MRGSDLVKVLGNSSSYVAAAGLLRMGLRILALSWSPRASANSTAMLSALRLKLHSLILNLLPMGLRERLRISH